ncbi:MAG: D-alanine--D-alanine ligase, partial [Taibaiella sp.]|nr:D-alanine--D-alanine ligase [Taibaiella sp.]
GKKIDVVFPVLHGCNGEDGTIQGLFELAGIPYVGCGVLGSALGMDKGFAKIVFEKEGIPQGKYVVFTRKQINQDMDSLVRQVEALLTYPCFVKPSNAGSSVGISKAHDRRELAEALHFAARYDRRILVEEFIDGREVECAVLGNDEPVASTVGEVVPCNEFYDYEAKYNSGGSSTVIIPAHIPDELIQKIRDYAVRAFKALDLSGLSRVDFFVHKDTGEVFINEVNTLPGFTSISMYPKLWEASGIPYSKLIEKLIDLAVERFSDNKREIGD